MATTLNERPTGYEDRIGDLPRHRVLRDPSPGIATEADAIRYLDGPDRRLVELIDGVLVEKPRGLRESFLASWLITCLNNFIVPRRLGIVGAPDALVRMVGGNLRLPDVSYFPWSSLSGPRAAHERVGGVGPALAVEILSNSNTTEETESKLVEYFASGARLVWIVDPQAQSVEVFGPSAMPTVLRLGETLTGGELLPGFELPIVELFGYFDQPEA